MSKPFTPDCEHHLRMLSAPPGRQYLIRPGRDLFYEFGCKGCPGTVLVSTADVRGKSIPEVWEHAARMT